MEIYDQIMVLVATTGIGTVVYGFLEVTKPWLKALYNIPIIKSIWGKISTRFGINNKKAYDALIKLIAFCVAYFAAWQIGPNGDLFVLMGYTTETSYAGFAATAFAFVNGNLVINAFEQSRKAKSNA